ncbi:sensor histidine kinase [Sporosarcina siberiensis]|uniref:Sensor histidine kinase n=1 Tax=Sporosarcina siberiensis TaxID=1365606 RepID=A0ABW4SHT1_9BACL
MAMSQLLFQVTLDVLSIYAVMVYFAKEELLFNKKMVVWCAFLFSFAFLSRVSVSPSADGIKTTIAFKNFEILPVNSLFGIIGLICLLLLLNSVAFKLDHLEVIVTTFLAFTVWSVIRMFSIASVDFIGLGNNSTRIFTLFIVLIAYWLGSTKINQLLPNKSSGFTRIMVTNVFILLLLLIISANFESAVILGNQVFLFLLLFFVGTFMSWILIAQRKSEIVETRIHATEQYIPIIDDLVMEVRARQHEFSNKLLAISSLVETTDEIQVVREKMQEYVDSANLTNSQYELLNMDHKVIAGFLYTKMKRTEQLKRELRIERTIPVHQFRCEDADMIEVLGILIDNALEASSRGDKIYLSMVERDGHLELTVSNPSDYLSNEQFMKIFEIGVSTKSFSRQRGYGLYNVKKIAERYNGRIIARNEQKQTNMITLGIQFQRINEGFKGT